VFPVASAVAAARAAPTGPCAATAEAGILWARGRAGVTVCAMAEWWSIEIFDGTFSARRWKDVHSSSLIESAISNGAVDWVWHEHRWGVVLELAFERDEQWEAYRELPSVRAALDAVPDPVNGLLVYRGRGGGSGVPSRRRPKPFAGAGAIALPEPDPVEASAEADLPVAIRTGGGVPTPPVHAGA
jgi:hypothetical protein